jgi:hypothetical protein
METKRHTWRTRQEIEVCQDCIYVSANGKPDYEGYADSGHFERYTEGLKNWGDEPNTVQDYEDISFSWQACDFCGDKLGGNRYTASLMQLHEEESGS